MTSNRQGGGIAGKGGSSARELALRVLSAAVLAALAVGANLAGIWPFGVLVTALALVICWEWGRMARGASGAFDWLNLASMSAVIVAAVLAASGLAGMAVIWLAVSGGVLVLLNFGNGGWLGATVAPYVGLPLVSMIWLRSDVVAGWQSILLLFLLVWATDSFAFLAGRVIGGPKLWPRVSPKKTWSGAVGGLAGGAAIAALGGWALGVPDPMRLSALGLGLSLAAQAGDLLESALKRRFGAKDSSNLVPGHGGVFDRVDALMLAAVVAALIGLILDPLQPAAAVLGIS
jgi:phosphatidate cytidylyltransferase